MSGLGAIPVFLSAVSGEFKSYRLKLANQLGALKGTPYVVKVQEDFQQGGHTLLEKLADYIRGCEVVIHIAGDGLGARPTAEHERALLTHLGDGPDVHTPGWSYTQWEYRLAARFKKRVLVYLAQAMTPRDAGLSITQGDDEARRQLEHLQFLQNSGQHYSAFASHDHLIRDVFRDLGLEPSLKVNNLPPKLLGNLFKGRDRFLEQIRAALGHVEHKGHQRFAAITASATAAAVHGLGGIGKTRAAIEYGHRYAEEYTALLFVQADSPANLEQNLAGLCGPMVLNLPEKDAKETEVKLAAALRWLQQHPGWFVILDNVDTEEAARAVEGLLGRLESAGQVLVTSRLRGWSGAVESLFLDVLAVDDAAAFLLERTRIGRRKAADDEAQARDLANTLGQLALALEQAGAYIVVNRRTFAQYKADWLSKHDKVLEWFDVRMMQYTMSVAVTWQTSFDQLTPAARSLLHRLAWLAPDPIPESLLDVAVPGQGDAADMAAALANLEAYSLTKRDDDTPMFSVHRLVQDVTRSRLGEGAALNEALGWVSNAFVGDGNDVRTWATLVPLAPHAIAVAESADRAGIAVPSAQLMNQVGQLLHAKARHVEAEPLMRRVVSIVENLLDKTHPLVATAINNLASLLVVTGRLQEAEPLLRRAVGIWDADPSKEHPDVAVALNNLAQVLQRTDRLSEAEPLMRRALTIDESRLGKDHPIVALRLNNLFGWLHASRHWQEAEEMIRRALAIDVAWYKSDHPDISRDLNNLSLLFYSTDRLAEADPLIRRALAIDEAWFGGDHPIVAGRLHNLANLLYATKRPSEAEPLMRRSVEIFLNATVSTGQLHPQLRAALVDYAEMLKAMGVGEADVRLRVNDLLKKCGTSLR